jgi:methyltransferase-like protein 23
MAFPLQLKEYTIHDAIISLYEPDKEAVAESYQKGEILFPYWSQVWPAAIALARFIAQYPHFISNKKVVELAAGLGLPSFVAASHAASVLISDYAPNAVLCMQKTVAYHKLQNVHVQLLDWTALPEDLSAGVLLLSDVSYDTSLFAIQEKIVRQFLAQGTTVIISTPQRLVAKEAIAPMLELCTYQEEIRVIHAEKEIATTILVLEQRIRS